MTGSNPLAFTLSRLDRSAERRADEAWLAAQRARADVIYVPFADDKALLDICGNQGNGMNARLWSHPRLSELARSSIVEPVFLGLTAENVPVFAALIAEDPVEVGRFHDQPVKAVDLRSLALQGLLPDDELGVLAHARSLIHWHARHRFCANCGAPTHAVDGGYRRHCPSCDAQHFPRTDPVVIALAVAGERCLVGRQAHFAPGMYSALAGFVEPGETLEDAVRREIKEEAAIDTGEVIYHSSQPWPFPSSLMIGVIAEALSNDIARADNELEDARWVSRDEVHAMFEGAHPEGLCTPPHIAIANRLLATFVAQPDLFRKDV